MEVWSWKKVSGASSTGSGVYAPLSGHAWRHRRWGHLDELGPARDGIVDSCTGFCSVPGPLQTVQRAEFRGVVLASQALDTIHLNVNNLKCRSACWPFAGRC